MVSSSLLTDNKSISEEDYANIQKLRELVKEELTPFYDTDFNLLRWLRGHDNNFDVVVPKLKHHLAVRRSCLQLDNLTEKELYNHRLFAHHDIVITGDSGKIPDSLVCLERSGQIDLSGAIHTYAFNEGLIARIYNIERFLRAVMEKEAQTGRQHSMIGIFDMSGFKFDHRVLSLMKNGIRTDFVNEHYVELFHAVIVVNVPSFFFALWAMVKPLVPEKTLKKIHIFGHSKWHDEILHFANPEALPSYWNEKGGEKLFLADVKDYLPVDPSKYYVPDKHKNDSQYSILTVKAGKQGTIEKTVEKGQTLNWTLEADGHFAFGVYHSSKKDDKELKQQQMVYPLLNLPGPTIVPIDDKLICNSSGTYTLMFSNEHAWWHTLKIHYRLWVD